MSNHSKQPDAYHEYRERLHLSRKDRLPKMVLLANAEDERTGNASEVYAFMKPAGRYGVERIPRERAFISGALATELIAKNGMLPRDPEEAKKIVDAASGGEPREHWLYLKCDGWQADFTAFAHRGHVFGNANKAGLILKAPLSTASRKYPLASSGTAREWAKITGIAYRSSRLRLALCAAFAAPLLKVVDLQSFNIILAGKSKAGKSTALLAAGSVIGIGLESGLPNFNATPAALQEAAVEFVDRVLPVNEIGLVKGPRRDTYHALRSLTYTYSEGRDTARHSKSSYGREGESLEWRGIMLVSSENTYDALAEMAGEKRDEGEYARAFDVPAIRPGLTTIFDTFPRWVPRTDRDAWARKQLLELRALCGRQHGTAFDPYIQYLIAHRSGLRTQIATAMQLFLDKCGPLPGSGALQHAARNFAILYAGAVLARQAGLIPNWRNDKTLHALLLCYKDGLREIEHMQTIEDRAKQKLLHQIKSIKVISPGLDVNDVQGWFTLDGKGSRTYCIRTPEFANWFAGAAEERAAIKWLLESKLLVLADGKEPNFPNLEWAVTFPKVGTRGKRCYQFRDPALTV